MAQDFHDPLQVFDYMYNLLDDHKAALGIRKIIQFDETLIPEYPAILLNMEGAPLLREYHAVQTFLVRFTLDIWIFHALLTVGKGVRSRQDVQLATDVRKLIHSKLDMDGHIIEGMVDSEHAGRVNRVIAGKASTIVTTHLTWQGQNRVLYQDS